MGTYTTPGVYVEDIPRLPPTVSAVDTAIPVFIGYTEQAQKSATADLVLVPQRIRSLLEYRHYFGDAAEEKNIVVQLTPAAAGPNIVVQNPNPSPFQLFYSLQLFFANGGGDCYIISVGDYSSPVISTAVLEVGLEKAARVDEITLIVFPDALHLDTAAACYGLYKQALKQCNEQGDRFAIMDVYRTSTNWREDVQLFRTSMYTDVSLLKYGAAYFPALSVSLDYNYKNPDTGLDNEENVLINSSDPGAFGNNLAQLKTLNNALYYQVKQGINELPMELPASPAIAGIYASVDRSRGVWKAPANINMNAVIAPTIQLSEDDQDELNVDIGFGISINAIRSFPGRGPALVWGARTLAGNDNEWRYVSVRRYFIMVEESVKKSTEWVVFEPNTAATWVKVQAMIENFLMVQWRSGALQGAKPEHAYYVSVGLGKTMTSQDILEGRLIVEIGMAVVRPAEFVILRFAHKLIQE